MKYLRLSPITVTVGLFLTFWLLLTVLAPPFFTYDSYDYLQLSIKPLYGASHPLGFGYLLRTLAGLADAIDPRLFTKIFIAWNSLGLAIFCTLGFLSLANLLRSGQSNRIKITLLFSATIFGIPVIAALLFVSNAFWSEATNFMHIGLGALLLSQHRVLKSWMACCLAFGLSAWSYHTRYLELVIPLCWLCVGLIPMARSLVQQRLKSEAKISRPILLFIFGMLGIGFSSQFLKKQVPSSDGQSYVTNLVISSSIQCALRCEVSLYEANCNTESGRELIEKSKCSELIFHLKPFGNYLLNPLNSPIQNFEHIGVYKTAKWLVLAPLTYLTDIHAMEMGSFRFGDDPAAVKAFPETISRYSRYFTESTNQKVSPRFMHLVGRLDRAFKKHKSFHLLTILAVFVSLIITARSKNPTAQYFALYSLGTYFLLAYLNPHVPFRYLTLVTAPAYFGALLHFAPPRRRTKLT